MISVVSQTNIASRKNPGFRIPSKVSKFASITGLLLLATCHKEPERTFLELRELLPVSKTSGKLRVHSAGPHLVLSGKGALSILFLVPKAASLRLGIGLPGSGSLALALKADGTPIRNYRLTAESPRAATMTIDLAPYENRPLELDLGTDGTARVDLAEGRVTVRAPQEQVLSKIDLRLRELSLPYRERSRSGEEEPRLAPARNVLLFLLDALRASSLSCYGNLLPASPCLDRLSRHGLLLARNFSQAPNTPPSVKAMLTGRYLPSTGHRKLPEAALTLPELFLGAGFRTAVFSSTPYVSERFGTTQGFEFVDKLSYVPRSFVYSARPPEKHYAGFLSRRFLEWMRGQHGGRFFAYIHAIHPHNPYTPSAPWNDLFTHSGACGRYDGSTPTLLGVRAGKLPLDRDAVVRHHKLLYLEDLAYADYTIGSLLAGLRKGGRDRETLTVMLADHGDEFLEHGGILHGYTAYDEMLRVPVILAGGGASSNRSPHMGLTQTIDLFPAIAHAAGIPVTEAVEGRALGARRAVYASASSAPGIFSLRTDSTKYIFAPGQTIARHVYSRAESRRMPRRMVRQGGVRSPGMGKKLGRTHAPHYLFDLARDPGETRNLASSHPVATEFWHRRLVSWLDKVDTGPTGDKPTLSKNDCAALAALGYIDRNDCP